MQKILRRTLFAAAISVLAAAVSPAQTQSVHAEASTSPSVYLDGRPLAFTEPPVIKGGFSLVPMRSIFEAEGAKVTWEPRTKTVTAVKDAITLTYRIGDQLAYKNAQPLTVPFPGEIINGSTMIPLRFVSESLGNAVKWHDFTRSITISTSHHLETTIEYGVNLRTAPDKSEEGSILKMLPKGESIHVIREIDANWLEVQTKENDIGFLSAKPMYTNYTSSALADKQGDALLAFGSEFLGTPYEFGAATNQTNTFDCSSFAKYVFDHVLSIELPRASYEQAKIGKEVAFNDLRKGDLLFFKARGLDIGHVAIYAGDGMVLHTFSKVRGVHFMKLDEAWTKRFVTARRLF